MAAALHRVTVEELKHALTLAEGSALPKAVTDGSSDGLLEETLLHVCDLVVGRINACPQNARLATGLCKVPAECVGTVLVLAQHRILSKLPGMAEALEGASRAAEYQQACRALEALAACELLPVYEAADGELADGGADGGGVGVAGRAAVDWML